MARADGVAILVGDARASIGPLVGVSFISAVRTYAEASGLNGTAAGVGEAFSPLIGDLGADVQRVRAGARRSCFRSSRSDRSRATGRPARSKIELQQRRPPFARIVGQSAGPARWRMAHRLAARPCWRSCSGEATAEAVYLPEL